ncbi:MAG: DUF1385 domain-containing protein [Armatimonadetes bacterium]|nr:DUF1385 domain-containing protein [Armatimonadota bacterium]
MARTLGDPIITSIRAVRPLYIESSLSAAIEAIRESGADAVPVLDGSFVVGVVWSEDIKAAALADVPQTLPISQWLDTEPPRILPNAGHAEARAILTSSRRPSLVVVDNEGRYLGLLTTLDLLHPTEVGIRPPFIGGMATPFGVFLTNGEVSGGAGPAALVATGGFMVSLLIIGVHATLGVLDAFGPRVNGSFSYAVMYVLPPVFFFVLLRVLPISGTHGAEHMVVHAIERREPLAYDVVKRMPRVHPRCGTNLAIGAMLFMGLIQALWPDWREVGALLALVMTMAVWRPLGSLFQQYITTKTPTRAQLERAMAAGEELLARYKQSSHPIPSFGRRLLMSGLPWVLLGSTLMFMLLRGVLLLFDLDPAPYGLG